MKKGNAEKKKTMTKPDEFELCKVCRINHNQGRRHSYFPRHINSLFSLFSRFRNKFSRIESDIKNPTVNRASSTSSFWCIFCEFDVGEVHDSFASGNVIKHLASGEHLKNVKQFLWKYGGGSNKVDTFRVTEAEFDEWEKKCEVLRSKSGPTSGIHQGSLCEESNDIRPNYGILNNIDRNNVHFVESNLPNNVLPLQYDTNKNYQVHYSDITETGNVGPSYQIPQGSECGLNTWNKTYIGYGSVQPLPSGASNFLADDAAYKGVHKNQSTTSMEPSHNGYQTLTRIISGKSGDETGNVYSGGPPPWLKATESTNETEQPTTVISNSAQKNSRKTSKLNPKRVGAGWAEKRRKEMEMEKRGEIVANTSAPDWLPNFGRVWESGSRKESMEEFKKDTVGDSVPKANTELEPEMKLQPYIGKRKRNGTSTFSGGGIEEAGDIHHLNRT